MWGGGAPPGSTIGQVGVMSGEEHPRWHYWSGGCSVGEGHPR